MATAQVFEQAVHTRLIAVSVVDALLQAWRTGLSSCAQLPSSIRKPLLFRTVTSSSGGVKVRATGAVCSITRQVTSPCGGGNSPAVRHACRSASTTLTAISRVWTDCSKTCAVAISSRYQRPELALPFGESTGLDATRRVDLDRAHLVADRQSIGLLHRSEEA